MSDLNQLINEIHQNAYIKGFWSNLRVDDDALHPDIFLAKLALVHSEISEILEAYRKRQGPEAIAEEFADVAIRLFDIYEVFLNLGLVKEDFETVLRRKVEKNTTRPPKHGNLI